MICTYPDCARIYGGCGCIQKPARDPLLSTTISSSGLNITIACSDHDTKDQIMHWLECHAAVGGAKE